MRSIVSSQAETAKARSAKADAKESNSIFLPSRLPSRHRAFAVSSPLPLVRQHPIHNGIPHRAVETLQRFAQHAFFGETKAPGDGAAADVFRIAADFDTMQLQPIKRVCDQRAARARHDAAA